jgi:hypothetical protein
MEPMMPQLLVEIRNHLGLVAYFPMDLEMKATEIQEELLVVYSTAGMNGNNTSQIPLLFKRE